MINIHDAMREREKLISSLQAQISVAQKEIEALRIAVRILEGDGVAASEAVPATAAAPATTVVPATAVPATAVPVSTLAAASPGGAEKPRVWP